MAVQVTDTATTPEARTFDLRIAADGSLHIPPEICDAFGLLPGDTVQLDSALVGFTATPVATDEEIEAFWGPNIRQELEEAEARIKAGRATFHESDEAFFAALEARTEDADSRGG